MEIIVFDSGITQPEDKGILFKDIIEDNLMTNPASIVGRRLNERGVRDDYDKNIPITQCLQVKPNENKSACLSTVEKDNVLTALPPGRYPNAYGVMKVCNTNPSGRGMNGNVFHTDGKAPCITTNKGEGNKITSIDISNSDIIHWRKLTPIECERLQTVPDNFTNHVSNSQRYKMLGNGWTIDVISHILKHIPL